MSRAPRDHSSVPTPKRVARFVGLKKGRGESEQSVRTANLLHEFIDPLLLANIEDLELIARTVVEGFLHGLHQSPYVGFSVEFASHREYLPGDDLRHLNWKLYARNDKLYIKQYDAETNLDCHLVVDLSTSMETKSLGISKRRYATMLAAAVAHLALAQRDAVGITLFADRVLAHVKPRAKANQLDEILATLVRCPGRTPARSAGVLHEVAELMPRRGLVVLVSDLFFETEEVFSGLDHFRFHGHDLVVFHVLDPLEYRMPLEGQVRFRDLETGDELTTQVDEIRAAYTAAVAAWQTELDAGCRGREIDRVALCTDQPLERALDDYLTKRSQLY
ncbi:MAG: DUF58 domain-containing protein [Isosphaeraceae bacterium]